MLGPSRATSGRATRSGQLELAEPGSRDHHPSPRVGVAVVSGAHKRSVRVQDHAVREDVSGHADGHEDMSSAVPNVTIVTSCDDQLLHARLMRLSTPVNSPDPIRGRGRCGASDAAAGATILPGRTHPSRPG